MEVRRDESSRVKREGAILGRVGEKERPLPLRERDANCPVEGFWRQKLATGVEAALVVELDEVVLLDEMNEDVLDSEVGVGLELLVLDVDMVIDVLEAEVGTMSLELELEEVVVSMMLELEEVDSDFVVDSTVALADVVESTVEEAGVGVGVANDIATELSAEELVVWTVVVEDAEVRAVVDEAVD